MAHAAHNPQNDSAQDLADAFNVHSALIVAERERPHLKDSPRWQMLRMDAYEEVMTLWWGGAR